MNTNAIKLVAGIAWAGLAVASAAPASALAFTTQSGNHAACSATITPAPFECSAGLVLYSASYKQNIKFVTTACSSGGCNAQTATAYTDQTYAPGRKTAAYLTSCENYNVYQLGTCAC